MNMPLEIQGTQRGLGLETIVLFVSDLTASRAFYETALGLRTLAPADGNPQVALYSAGHVQLCLLPADQHGVTLQEGRDRSADITFMTDNFARCREVLEGRGVRFSRTLEYSIGTTADFYDPDGHWFSLYQPSETALGWPSGPKLTALASSLPMRQTPPADDLADAFIAYVFLFFSDPDVAEKFYGEVLELEAVEGGPCRRIPTRAPVGVVKYDAGTTLLTTHHVEKDDKRFQVATTGSSGVAFAFQAADVLPAVSSLSRHGISFAEWGTESPLGRRQRFVDPAGHVCLLGEPTQRAGGNIPAEAAEAR
jgi:catechol 2,3-dioxygenase-like lactoylglutathione lyase family enzyme